jgi:DNA-binding response OmpR family regulator
MINGLLRSNFENNLFPMKVLIVEDEKTLAESISNYLKQEGYVCEIALNYSQAEDKISGNEYDCIILDISLPDGNGMNLIKTLKSNQSHDGILVLSARNSIDDKIQGLELGADDYLTKPFHLSELNARIKSIFRRKSLSGVVEIKFNEIIINTNENQAFVNKCPLNLTRKEYELLIFFISNKNRVLTKLSIVEHLWGDNVVMADSLEFVYTHIKNLRKKIVECGGTDYIKTVYGLGYKFTDH